MFIRNHLWELCRDDFSEAEKEALRASVTGITICPKGTTVDEDSIAPALLEKLKLALARAAREDNQNAR